MGTRKLFLSVLLVIVTTTVVNAYTVVMRDGRRVEIPNEFSVTDSTLTYGMGSGIQITIQLSTVDVVATERANGEAPGAFNKKVNTPKARVAPAPQTRRTAVRSITNNDLEKYRRTRVASEKEYETTRRELGLPSMEERRLEAAAIQERTLEQVRTMRAQEEALWRSRADAFRAELMANEAQFGSLRQRQDLIPSFDSFPGFFPFDAVGFGISGGSFGRFRHLRQSPFSPFLATPITPFPTFPAFRGHRGLVFRSPGVVVNPRPGRRHGSRR